MDVLLATHGGEPFADQDDDALLEALARIDIKAEMAWWADPDVDWSAADLVVIRTAWDYFDRRDEFVAWAHRVEQLTRLENPAEVIAWNTHKGYLATLEERGAPIVPTAFLGRGDRAVLATLLADRQWPDAIIKPAIGGGSMGLFRVGTGGDQSDGGQTDLDGLLEQGDVLLQPFVRSVAHGELSIVLFDGVVSHAVRKVPAPGEIRIQVEFGGTYREVAVPEDAANLARWIVQASGHRMLFSRVDLLADDDGSWMLAELEVTEPSLYLNTVPAAADRLAGVIGARLAITG
ncbi:MAG: glutathione synthase/RimK-type ligase-like ATP-grasp enzyme [Glaciecola sp.]